MRYTNRHFTYLLTQIGAGADPLPPHFNHCAIPPQVLLFYHMVLAHDKQSSNAVGTV